MEIKFFQRDKVTNFFRNTFYFIIITVKIFMYYIVMYDSTKFANIMKKSGLTANEAWHLIQFSEEDLVKYKKSFNEFNMNNQTGGSSKSIKYKGTKYVFQQSIDGDRYMISLRQNMNPNMSECLLILIDPLDNYAYVENISNLEGCLQRGIVTNKGGNDLVKLMILYLHKVKDKYNIKYIKLSDTATKYINGESIVLRNLMYLTKGYTWYEKFGFIPCYVNNKGKIKFSYDKYKNVKIQLDAYTKKTLNELDTVLIKKELLDEDNQIEVKALTKLIRKNPTKLIKDFVNDISKNPLYAKILNDLFRYIIDILDLRIHQSLCADINNAYDLVINGNI